MRNANVTNERDPIYGIHGLKSLDEPLKLPVSYEIDEAEVCGKFAPSLLEKEHTKPFELVHSPIGENNDLSRGLRAVVPPRWQYLLKYPKAGLWSACTHNLPFWVVCRTCSNTPVASLISKYNPSGTWKGNVQINTSGRRLGTRTIFARSMRNLSAFRCDEVDPSYPYSNGEIYRSAYGDGEATSLAFLYTIVAGSADQRDTVPATSSIIWTQVYGLLY